MSFYIHNQELLLTDIRLLQGTPPLLLSFLTYVHYPVLHLCILNSSYVVCPSSSYLRCFFIIDFHCFVFLELLRVAISCLVHILI